MSFGWQSYSQNIDSSKVNLKFSKGNFCLSNNLILNGVFTIGDSLGNQQILVFGLAPTFEYAILNNWFTGIGLSYQRTNYYTLKNLENENHFDLLLNTRYNFRASKKVNHFLELTYMGGERSRFKPQFDSTSNSQMPYVSKLRFAYGFHIQPNKYENIGFGFKLHKTYHVSSKEIYKDYGALNFYMNYYIRRRE